MSKFIKSFLSIVFLTSVFILPHFALAIDAPGDKLFNVGENAGYNTRARDASLPAIVGEIIAVALTLLGIIFLALMVYAGVLWMIAAGNEDKVTRSKDTMRRAAIGLIIVVGSYAISQFVIYSILK